MKDKELIRNLEKIKYYVNSCAATCGDKVHGHIETLTLCQEMIKPNHHYRHCGATNHNPDAKYCYICGGKL